MNITRIRQEDRIRIIDGIVASIRASMDKELTINKDDVIMATMANFGLSRRTAREYVEVAYYKLNLV